MSETTATAETPPPAAPAHEDRTLPIVVYVLYLLGLTHGLTILIGVVIAYVARDGAGPVARSHYDMLIRTFWVAVVGALIVAGIGCVGLILTLVLIGFPILMGAGFLFFALWVWVLVRCVIGLIHLSRGEAYPRPGSWLA